MTDTDFIRAICADPVDTCVRLVYADYLEEHGQAERAEFIKAQCELAEQHIAPCVFQDRVWPNSPPACCAKNGCPVCFGRIVPLRCRERELFVDVAMNMFESLPQELSNLTYSWGHNHVKNGIFDFEYRRGFVEVISCRLEDWCGGECLAHWEYELCPPTCLLCHGTGRVGGHGPAIVACQPIRELRITSGLPSQADNPVLIAWARSEAKKRGLL